MAEIIIAYQWRNQQVTKVPIIHCEKDKACIEAVSINKILSIELKNIDSRKRSLKMQKVLRRVINSLPDYSVIKDFDVMFNPQYCIDVLQMFIDIRRGKPFEIIWPGSYEDEKLIYGEENYEDYKVFNLAEYELTCIV